MNIKFLTAAVCVVLATTAIKANAQTAYTEGIITYSVNANGTKTDAKGYFSADSSMYAFSGGPASIKLVSNASFSYFAVYVDIPVASKSYDAVASPADIEDFASQMPTFTFATGTETKQISGFNCKKVVATDTKSGKTYDLWVTNDFTFPPTAVPSYYTKAGGFPVEFTRFSMGQGLDVTVTSIVQQTLPKGTFSAPPDAEKITLEELSAMRGGH